MNSRSHLDRKLQFDFLINTVRPRKRYNKWVKADKIEAIELVKTYYGYSTEKARQALSILTSEQLDHLKQKLEKGGL
jgi:putative heme iron utilization protein